MTVYKRLEKTSTNKKIMHGLHNMLYSERKMHLGSIFTVFARGYLSSAIFIFYGKTLTMESHKMLQRSYILLNMSQHGLHIEIILFKLLIKDNWFT